MDRNREVLASIVTGAGEMLSDKLNHLFSPAAAADFRHLIGSRGRQGQSTRRLSLFSNQSERMGREDPFSGGKICAAAHRCLIFGLAEMKIKSNGTGGDFEAAEFDPPITRCPKTGCRDGNQCGPHVCFLLEGLSCS